MTVETLTVAPPKVKTTADVLRHAARIIEERGWMQGWYSDADGRVCADEAVRLAMGLPRNDGFFCAADEAFHALHGRPTIGFNDAPGRTAAEVTAALRAAADAAEAA